MCLHTKKLILSFSVRNKDDIFSTFLIPPKTFSYIKPTGVHYFLSLHSHMKKLVKLTIADKIILY